MRQGTIPAQARTQSSIAVGDGEDWALFNASPDIRTQLGAFADLQPGRAVRDTAIRAIVLIDAQIDHTTGLMMLREHSRPLEVYCTSMVYQDLTGGYPLFRVLEHYCGVEWHAVPVDGEPFKQALGTNGVEHLQQQRPDELLRSNGGSARVRVKGIEVRRQLLQRVIDHLPDGSQRMILRNARFRRDLREHAFLSCIQTAHRRSLFPIRFLDLIGATARSSIISRHKSSFSATC